MRKNKIVKVVLTAFFWLGLVVWIGGMYWVYRYYQREIGYLLHPYGGLIEWRGAEWYVGWFFCTVGIILMLVGGIVAKLRYVPIMFLVIGSIGILSSSMFLFNMVGDWMKNHWHIFRGVIWDILGIVSLFLLPFVGCIVAGALIGRRRRTRA